LSLGKIWQLSDPTQAAHDHQQAYRIIITTAATARNIPLIVETITASHAGIAYHVEHNAHGTPPHHGFSLLISVECACVEQWCSQPKSLLGAKHFWGGQNA